MKKIPIIGMTIAAYGLCLQAMPVGEVVAAGNFIHVVTNLDQTVGFYRDVLGLELNGQPGPRAFAENLFVSKLYGTPGAQSRVAILRLPDPAVALEFAEFKDIDQADIHPRPQDPGASVVVLTVRSLDMILARARQSGVPIATPGGDAVVQRGNEGTSRMVVLKDPDGFYVELTERSAAPESAVTGNVIGASLILSIADTDQTMHLYRDLIGFQPRSDASFRKDEILAKALGVDRAEVRHSIGNVPGSNFQVDFVEWKGSARKPAQARIFDHGAGVLRLRVREVDPFVSNLKAAGIPVASAGGGPVEQNANMHVCILQDSNGFFFQIMPAPRPQPQQ